MKYFSLFIFFAAAFVAANAQPAVRIITAGSAITETVCALGDGDKIVATDRTSLYPASMAKLPSIGYRNGINAEGILGLNPTLVIAEKDYVDDAVLRQLAGVPSLKLVVINRKLTPEDTRRFITEIAAVLGREREGKDLVAKIDRDLAEVKTLLAKQTTRPKVVCIYNRGTATISAAGKDTFAAILDYVGATNAFASIEGYKPLATEALVEANPDYLVMLSTGFESAGGMEGVLEIAGVKLTTAGKKQQVVAVEALKLTNFGPRLGEAVRELALLLHPELRAK